MSNYYTDMLKPADVMNARTFAAYAQQTLGTPHPSTKDWATLNAAIKRAFQNHPGLDYQGLCRVVQWARTHKKRPVHTHLVVGFIRYAWADGVLPELDPREARNLNVEAEIVWALEREEDPDWRRRLIATQGMRSRADVLQAWKNSRASALNA